MFVEFEAIHQVLLLHQGPIFEFSLLTENEDGIDQMIFLLARNKDTLKKLTLRLPESCDHLQELPLSIYSLHQLTDLYITGIFLGAPSTLSGFGNLTSLYVQGVILSKDLLLNLLSNCPLLKHFELIGEYEFDDDGTKLVTLKDCSDVWLEHWKELEIVGFAARNGEMEFVKLILAKSPVLMKVRIILNNEEVTKDEELEIGRILLGSPHVSSLAEMTIDCQAIA